jgi:protein-S-isoprenylcysteine O-methyltransferase Ste14
MTSSIALNSLAVCWISFVVVWIVAAGWTKRSVYNETRWQRARYSILLLAAYVVLVNGGRLPYPLNLRLIPHTGLVDSAGVTLCVAGLAFAFWARFTIGRNWSGTITLKKDHQLIRSGPYRLVRHPIYTGLLAMLLGTQLVFGRVAGFLSVGLAFLSFWIKLRDEEELMLKQFPQEYRAYQQQTKQIIPYLL